MASSPLSSRPPRRVPLDPELRARDESLESLKAVAGKLAHDFNNFLVPQFGYITLLKEELSGSAGTLGAQYLANMESAGRKSESYIDAILLGMRPHRQFSPQRFAFGGMVEAMLEKWISELPASAAIQVERQIDPCEFHGDEKQCRCLVEHLLANARFALAMGGRLGVSLSRQTLTGDEVMRLGLGGPEVVRLEVSDSGFGMAPEVARRAFEPFFTTRSQIKAAGLGLTIVHSVALFHGGQVALRSEEDKGTQLTVWLPAGGFVMGERPSSTAAGKAAPRRHTKVLLVEDDPLIKEVLRTWLGRYDLEVHQASNGTEATRMLGRSPGDWSLLIVDLDLRDGSGESVLRQTRSSYPDLPNVVLTGGTAPGLEAPVAENGPLLVKKPCSLKALTEAVLKHLNR